MVAGVGLDLDVLASAPGMPGGKERMAAALICRCASKCIRETSWLRDDG